MSIKGTIAAQLTTVDNSTSPDRDVRSGIMPQEAAPLAWKEVSKSGVDTASAHTIGAGKALSNELVDRFEAALRRSCKKPYQDVDKLSSAKPSVPHRFGIAVSGGVDSTALAVLCKSLQSRQPEEYSFHAIVVDHKARSNSSEEAAEVVGLLGRLGLKASIRAVQWPEGAPDAARRDFETQARRLRYRQLGAECLDQELRYLLLAHHADDQAETILGRIVSGHTGAGLQGIRAAAHIPECADMWGVAEGPGTVQFSRGVLDGDEKAVRSRMEQMRGCKSSETGCYMAAPGITIHRPLLEFTKIELREICEETGTQWKEDPTNADVGLTARNALRSLLQSNKLPLALRKSALLGLGLKTNKRRRRDEANGEAMFNKLQILSFDPRFGCLKLQLNAANFVESDHEDAGAQADVTGADGVPKTLVSGSVANLISRIASLVSPYQQLSPEMSWSIAQRLLQEVHHAEHGKSVKFTGLGACWHKLQIKKPSILGQIWEVSRQVPSRANPPLPCTWASQSKLQHIEGAGLFGSWQLLDNRYWVQVSSSRPNAIVARTSSHVGEVESFRKRWPGDQKAQRIFNEQIKSGTDQDVRQTLPILAMQDTDEVVALPTLGLLDPKYSNTIFWKIRYKTIDLGSHEDTILRNSKVLTA